MPCAQRPKWDDDARLDEDVAPAHGGRRAQGDTGWGAPQVAQAHHTIHVFLSIATHSDEWRNAASRIVSHFLTVPTFGYLASNLDFQSFRMSFSIRLRPAVMPARQGHCHGTQHLSTHRRAFRVWHAVLLVQGHLGKRPVGLPVVACGRGERQSSASALSQVWKQPQRTGRRTCCRAPPGRRSLPLG